MFFAAQPQRRPHGGGGAGRGGTGRCCPAPGRPRSARRQEGPQPRAGPLCSVSAGLWGLREHRFGDAGRVPIVASRRGGAGCSAGGLVCFSEVYSYFFLGSPVVACPGSAHGALRWRAAAHLCHRAFLNAVFCKLGIPALGPPLQLLQLRSWLSSVSHSP